LSGPGESAKATVAKENESSVSIMKQKHQSTKVGKGYGTIPKKLKGNT
tara:strand:- start:291 stop:434 length:144 start_codon:yes stop_codon:yes gene_type:complete